MAYVSLYRKYRPQTFDEILGQEHISNTLKNAITEGRVAHAYLFTGPRGTGKTSTARILAKALNCAEGPTPQPCGVCGSCVAITNGSSLDVFEMDAASHSGVDETREILAGVSLATAGSRKKVYVIDEVHMLTTQSFNALLKTLEEPPEHVIFVLATTEAHKVLPTIVSRTQRFDFRRIPTPVLEDHISEVGKMESIDIDPAAVASIARHADGSARDALSTLDQLASFGGSLSEEDVERLLGERGEDAILELFDAIAAGDIGGVFSTLDSLVTQGADARQLALQALEHGRSLLLLKTAPDSTSLLDASDEDRDRMVGQAESFRISELLRTLDLVGKAITEMRTAPNHRLFLEVALVRSAAPETDPSAEGLLGRIERLERRIGMAGAEVDVAAPAPEPAAKAPARKKPAEAPQESAPVAQASSESAPVAQASSESAPVHIGLNHIRDAWPATLKEVGKHSRRVGAFLNPSRPESFDNGALVVEVQSGFHAKEMSKDLNRSILSEALYAALGVRPDLLFAERGGEPERPDQQEGQHSGEDWAEAAEAPSAEHDPVELMKKGLGAEVVKEVDEEA